MKEYRDSRKMLRLLERDGWRIAHQVGSHIQLKHPTKKNRVTVPHPQKDTPLGTVKNILKQAEIEVEGD
ncbi:type II toxin-antitoxin system HicA family toxin [Tumebacillus sp. DT12]|uniref:Type II toxin-antitoxin system HicA family toxin n=1 Tax=Tumebacillus lacus TaxID=2995335 RepID=A0ABT3WY92_9BACL|nr:type II toxin-antitoxin system HicA family toxin [Tumebacillus lacus]MCX7568722.1 type II toxin-antitoxin system HicA family toxin [Tumebacillus lacus]